MGSEFFELPAEEQQKSLTAFAHELLTNYGISKAKVSCINFGFNATFSVETETGLKYALRININSAKTIKNLLAEIEWVRHLNHTSGINTPAPIATLKDDFIVSAVHPESGQTLSAVMYSWLEGEEIGDEPTLDQLHEVGKAIAQLHQDSSNFVLSSQLELPTFDDFFWSTEDFLLSEKSKLSVADRSDSAKTTFAPPCKMPMGCVFPSTGMVATSLVNEASVISMPIFLSRAPLPRALIIAR